MTAPVWVAELAAWFWNRAGPPPPFPRELSGAVTRSLIGSVISLRGLSVGRVLDWLANVGIQPPDLQCPDRPLRGALFAREGAGFLFVARDDEPTERRFTLAHELAHLLRDYLQPRNRAIVALGPGIVDVLDARRPPTVAERFHGLLRDVPAAPFTHLMGRDDGRRTVIVRSAERDADRLAFELLAPAVDVLKCRGTNGATATAAQLIADTYGLPSTLAEYYANELFPCTAIDPLLMRLKK
jgi:uncharacterized protein DUF955